jgi:hypothetical protein
MARTKFVTIATFLTPEMAYLARTRLDAEGIAAFLENESAVGMLGVLSNAVGGVKLQVEQADVERAAEILELATDDDDGSGSNVVDVVPWTCGQCGEEVEGTFDVCWSCGASRDGEVDPTFKSHAPRTKKTKPESPGSELSGDERDSPATPENDAPPLPLRHDDNPYRSPQTLSPLTDGANAPRELTDDDIAEDETPDQLALRAFRAAILGLFFFMCAGLLNLYSVYVLAKIGSPGRLSAPMKTRYLIALVIDLAVALVWGIVLFDGFFRALIFDRPRMW